MDDSRLFELSLIHISMATALHRYSRPLPLTMELSSQTLRSAKAGALRWSSSIPTPHGNGLKRNATTDGSEPSFPRAHPRPIEYTQQSSSAWKRPWERRLGTIRCGVHFEAVPMRCRDGRRTPQCPSFRTAQSLRTQLHCQR